MRLPGCALMDCTKRTLSAGSVRTVVYYLGAGMELSVLIAEFSRNDDYPSIKKMPSLQKALPPELADNVLRLYRECLRRAKYIGHQMPFVTQKHNTELLVTMVREQFKKNMHETDPEKIQKMKDDAARGLINHILYESEKMTGRKFSG
ncbi:hypothetical protein PR202_ga12155 [Eleusine coracana subsp. coracana]|uniref:Complex 1 LYR protein domain-containing protein n=1 Tax=Eleusine coracana subsp. coracana TaxID=191504 RepID=A0AAV5CBC4_ELECO|nr:hypothetical protein PR202_ga12155 [Eleusine coracana subsp. coracana]